MEQKAIVFTPQGGAFGQEASDDMVDLGLEVVTEISGGAVVRLDLDGLQTLANAGFHVKPLPDADQLRIRGRVIDLRDPTDGLVRTQRLSAAERKEWQHHVVQFEGPPLEEFIQTLERRGLQVVQQLDRYAVSVVGSAEVVAKLTELPEVAAAFAYEPGMRIAAGLADFSGKQQVQIGIHPPEALDKTLEEVEDLKLQIDLVDRPGSNADRFARSDGTVLVRATVEGRQQLNNLARIPAVHFIEPYAPFEPTDERSAQIVAEDLDGVAVPNTGPNLGYQATLAALGLTGDGVTIGVIDTGIDDHNSDTMHQDLRGRLAFFADQSGGANLVDSYFHPTRMRVEGGHGTHVAGIAAGDASTGDVDPQGFLLGQGVAPAAQVGSVNLLAAFPQPSVDTVIQAAATNGSDVNNNSWGAGINGYDANCSTVDQRVRDPDPSTADFEEMCIVFACGNSGGLASSISSPSESKNAIHVGNLLNRRPGEGDASDDIRGISRSSSRGPTADGRICPTVVAPGTDVISAFTTQDGLPGAANPGVQRLYTQYTDTGGTPHPLHTSLSGTSMAAPHVSGVCALLIEWWRDRTGATPSPAMLKALLVNGAEDMAGGPNWRNIVNGPAAWNAIGPNQRYVGIGFTPGQIWGWSNAVGLTQYTQRNTVAQIVAAGEWNYNAGTDTLTVRSLSGSVPWRPTTNAAGNPIPWDRVFALDNAPIANIPNNDQGWGRVSVPNIVEVDPASDRGPKIFSDQRIAFTANGQRHRIRVAPVDPSRPMRVTLCWTDPAGPTLINDLDLVVTEVGAGGDIYRGNPANFAGGFTNPGGFNDSVDNTECVYIQNPNGTYDIEVVAGQVTRDARTGIAGSSPWQDYALVIDNAAVPSVAPVNIATVIDRSGSMVTSGYVDRTVQASSAFVDLLNVDDAIGVVSFGGTAVSEYDDGGVADTIVDDTERDAATQAIDDINFGGSTAMGPGITLGAQQLMGAAGERAMVLLTDGYDNGTPDAASAVAGLDPDIKLYTCAMGPASDQVLLEQLASATDGKYYFMPTIDDLFEIYNWIRGQVSGTAVIANESSQASHSRVGAFVDACSERASFTAAWPDPRIEYVAGEIQRANQVSVRLRTPNGKLLKAKNGLVRTVVGKGYVTFDVDQPAPGQWFVEVETKRAAHLPYTVGGFTETEIATELLVPTSLLPGQRLPIEAIATRARKRIDASTSICLGVPRFSQEDILEQFGRDIRRVTRTTRGDSIPDEFAALFTATARAAEKGLNLGEMVERCFELRKLDQERTRPTITDLRRINDIRLTGIPNLVEPVIDISDGARARASVGAGAGAGLRPPLRGVDLTSRFRDIADVIDIDFGAIIGPPVKPITGEVVDTERPGSYNIVATISGNEPECGHFAHKQFASVRVGNPKERFG